MKKLIALIMVVGCLLMVVGCGETTGTENSTPAEATTTTAAATEATRPAPIGKGDDAKSEGVMTYAEYMAAEMESAVVIEAFVQDKQSWWEDKATVYAQDADGGYFIYNMECSKADYAKLVPGTKIRVEGFKTEWSGEVEIAEGATFEIVEADPFIAAATDVTSLLGTDDLIAQQNKLVAFKGLTVEAYDDSGATFVYNWDGSGEDGDDLYFKASVGDKTYSFTVESYLCGKDSDVYKAVKALKAGDKIDMEGFLYWYEGANPHIVSVTTAA